MKKRILNPSIHQALEVLATVKNPVKKAMMLEAAVHEAGHAVISVILGGDAFATEIYWTDRARKEQASWGSCGMGCTHDNFDRAVSRCAGPIAASLLTGYRFRGSDYPEIHRMCEGADPETAELWGSAEIVAEKMVRSHWISIERLASIMLYSKGKRTLYKNEVRQLISAGLADPDDLKQFISEDIFEQWKKRAAILGVQYFRAQQQRASIKAKYSVDPKEITLQAAMPIWMMLQNFGYTVLGNGQAVPRLYL